MIWGDYCCIICVEIDLVVLLHSRCLLLRVVSVEIIILMEVVSDPVGVSDDKWRRVGFNAICRA